VLHIYIYIYDINHLRVKYIIYIYVHNFFYLRVANGLDLYFRLLSEPALASHGVNYIYIVCVCVYIYIYHMYICMYTYIYKLYMEFAEIHLISEL